VMTYLLATSFYIGGHHIGFEMGINGVWIGIALAMFSRAVWILIWHTLNARKLPKEDEIKAEGASA